MIRIFETCRISFRRANVDMRHINADRIVAASLRQQRPNGDACRKEGQESKKAAHVDVCRQMGERRPAL